MTVVIERLLWDESFQRALILADWMSGAGYSQEHSISGSPGPVGSRPRPKHALSAARALPAGSFRPRQVEAPCGGAGLACG